MDLSRPLYGATFGQAIKRYFKSYAKFSGRASRSEYWWSYLFLSLLSLIPSIFFMIGFFMVMPALAYMDYSYYDYGYGTEYYGANPFIYGSPAGFFIMMLSGIVLLVIGLGTIIPSIAIAWRRLHDGNFAGPLWFIGLGAMIPYVGFLASVALIVFYILPSKPEGRRFDRDLQPNYAGAPAAPQQPFQAPPQA
ncbi:DUF805 domain-containing protein [Leucobacter sp. 1207-22]